MLLRARIFFRYLTFAVGRQLRQRVAGEAGFEAAVLLRYLRKMDGFLDRSKGWDFLAAPRRQGAPPRTRVGKETDVVAQRSAQIRLGLRQQRIHPVPPPQSPAGKIARGSERDDIPPGQWWQVMRLA